MRLFEFDDNDPLRVSLTAVVSNLAGRIEDTNYKEPFLLKSFAEILNQEGIPVSEDDIRQMITKEPLSNFIDRIEGNQIIFKNQADETSSDAEFEKADQERTVKNMADKAVKNAK